MWEFIDRLFNIALPRVRDFRGINADSFDGRGNYALGIKEQLIFPEIEYDKIDKIRGMDIVIVTTAKTDEEARELLSLMGAPFAKISEGECNYGKEIYDPEAAERAQVLHPPLQPLQAVRPSPRLSAGLRRLPYLLPGAGLQGPDPRREKGILVIRQASHGGGRKAPPRWHDRFRLLCRSRAGGRAISVFRREKSQEYLAALGPRSCDTLTL